MELVLLGAVNVVLFVLLVVSIRLIRSATNRHTDEMAADVPEDVAAGQAATTPTSETTIDLRSRVAEAVQSSPRTAPTPVPVFSAVGAAPPPAAPTAPPPVPPPTHRPPAADPAQPSAQTRTAALAPHRSVIVVDAAPRGAELRPVELLFSVIQTLKGVGFELTVRCADDGMLVDAAGNTASIDLTKRSSGGDRVVVTIASPRAVETLAALELWHRSALESPGRVRISARIN